MLTVLATLRERRELVELMGKSKSKAKLLSTIRSGASRQLRDSSE